MTTFNKGDKVRYKSVLGYENWAGLEGVVQDYSGSNTEVLVTKDTGRTMGTYKGSVARLHAKNLELIPATAPLAVGDKVRVNEQALSHDWVGMEGVIVALNYIGSSPRIEITANPPMGYSVGSLLTLPPRKLDVVAPEPEAAPELPREVKLEDIRVGDTVRVTYPSTKKETFGVKQATTLVREGTVESISGRELSTDERELINAYFNGFDEATYTLLERPAPEPVLTTTTAEVGAQFKTTHRFVGLRLLTKVAEDKWSDVFLKSGNAYSSTDAQAQEAFDTRDGVWLEV